MLLTPFGKPLDSLISTYRDLLLAHHKAGQLFSVEGEPLGLDQTQPIWVWDEYKKADFESRLIYDPKRFSEDNHQGFTKREILEGPDAVLSFPGWDVKLIEDLPNLPEAGQGRTIFGRAQLEAGRTPNEYLQTLQTDSQYRLEQGFNPEDWLTLAITTLKTKNQVIDDWQGKGKARCLLGGWFPRSGGVGWADWYRGIRRANLYGSSPDYRDERWSAAASVRV